MWEDTERPETGLPGPLPHALPYGNQGLHITALPLVFRLIGVTCSLYKFKPTFFCVYHFYPTSHLTTFIFLQFQPGDDIFPVDEDGKVITDDSVFLDTWEVIQVLQYGAEFQPHDSILVIYNYDITACG